MKKKYILVFLFLINILQAQTLSLDTSFGTGGYHKYQSAELTSAIMLPDGQFITASFSSGSIVVKKISQNGIPDAAFGTKYHNIGSDITLKSEAPKRIILHNNKIIIVGRVNATPTHSVYELFISRINLDGTLDTTFGNNGFTTFSVGNNSKAIDAVVDSNGSTYVQATQNSSNFLVRITADGALDTTYANNGILSISPFICNKMFRQNDGKILLTGYKINSASLWESYIERRLSNGDIDLSFGTNGIIIFPHTTSTSIKNCHYDYSNNSITILHQTNDSYTPTRLFLSKIQISDGSLISGFGSNGITTNYLYTDARDISIAGFAVLPDSKMIVAGNMSDFFGTNGTIVAQLFIARFNADGTKDTSFAPYGYKMFPATPPNTSVRADLINNLFITDNGSAVLAYSGSSATHGSSAYLAKFSGAYFLSLDSTASPLDSHHTLYPNPADQYFSITTGKNHVKSFTYTIIDLQGRIIVSGSSGFNQKISLKNISSGNYLVQINTEEGSRHCFKLLKR